MALINVLRISGCVLALFQCPRTQLPVNWSESSEVGCHITVSIDNKLLDIICSEVPNKLSMIPNGALGDEGIQNWAL